MSDECSRVGPADTQPPLTVVAELSCEADVTNLVDATVKKFGHLDILVNNAGFAELGSIETTSLEQYDRVMGVNVRAAFQLTRLSVPHLIATRGNVVNVSSVGGTRSFPGAVAYCMSKSAVDQMTSCTALELAAKGVRVNSVNPGVIVTDFLNRVGMTEDQIAQYVEHQKEVHPLGRVGEAEEVAQAIAFLASSSSASFITGEHLHVDSGLHVACPRCRLSFTPDQRGRASRCVTATRAAVHRKQACGVIATTHGAVPCRAVPRRTRSGVKEPNFCGDYSRFAKRSWNEKVR